jgi:transcriptional regulator GlxA family with amidase domain
MAGAKEDVYGQILEMFDELNEGLERADVERAAMKAKLDMQPSAAQIEQSLRLDERIGDMRAAILSDLHRLNAENKAGFRRELDEALDEKLPAMIAAEIGRREDIRREANEARWTKIRDRAQTIIAVASVATAAWALLELFAQN